MRSEMGLNSSPDAFAEWPVHETILLLAWGPSTAYGCSFSSATTMMLTADANSLAHMLAIWRSICMAVAPDEHHDGHCNLTSAE